VNKLIARISSWLSAPRTPLRLAILGVLLGAPSLGVGLFMDDFAHRAAHLGKGIVGDMREPWLMFSFTDGVPEHTRATMETGLYPWWTSETVLLNFWRPLTALTHAIDHALWPNVPALMHAQNLFWFALVILAVMGLYKRIGGAVWPAGLAGLLFTVDESHALPVAWIANRNALLALFFGVMCLNCHICWRETARTRWLALALLMLATAVHCNEGGIATCGYLFAYAVCLDRSPWLHRLSTLVPYGAIVVMWRIAYSAMGFGALGSPTYIDPGASPGRFAGVLVQRAPVLFSAQWFNLPGEPYDFLESPYQFAYWGVAVALGFLFVIAIWPVLRTSPQARFWMIGSALSLVPASTTFPSGRLLVFASVGGAALLAQYLIWTYQPNGHRALFHRGLAALFILIHVLLPPFALAGTSVGLGVIAHAVIDRYRDIPYPEDIANRRVFLINAPNYFLTTYSNVYRALEDLPTPEGMHTLSPNAPVPAKMTVTRIDADTLRFDAAEGFQYLLFRDIDRPFAMGDRIELEHLTVEILEVDAVGRAKAVHYHFPAPLESKRYFWLQIDPAFRFEPYTPPAIGASHTFYAG
jgi:hypothetical protein